MRYRVLIVGRDVDLLMIRQVLLTSWGYESLIATPEDVDEKLQSGRFDLVILSLMLGQEVKRRFKPNFRPARARCCSRQWSGRRSCGARWPKRSDERRTPLVLRRRKIRL